jgi:hypothetical protein
MFLHGFQVWTTRKQGDVDSGARHACTNVSANRSCARNQEFHD